MRCYFTPGIKARTWIYGKINTFHNVSIPNENYVILLFCSYFHPKNNNFHRHRKFNIIILYKIILRLATLQDFLIKKNPTFILPCPCNNNLAAKSKARLLLWGQGRIIVLVGNNNNFAVRIQQSHCCQMGEMLATRHKTLEIQLSFLKAHFTLKNIFYIRIKL